jgi:tetratricopeptide (TPR) repeat protein
VIRVVLCMILGDEAAVIERCLAAALPHVDGVVACVNGKDDTAQIVERVTSAAGVRCCVRRDEWKNFGHNRTQAARTATEWARAQGFDLGSTYLLFLDADHVLVSEGFERSQLTGGHYRLEQREPGLRYDNTRLGRADLTWTSVGVTHEYWSSSPDCPFQKLTSLWIDDRNDGGSKSNKSARDVALLMAALVTDPKNERNQFYLAQCYWWEGRWAEAAEWYEKRKRSGGFEEERWFAAYRHGQCLLRLDRKAEGAVALLEAWGERPHRAEPLVELARHYREAGRNAIALMLARQAMRTPLPASDTLFVDVGAHTVVPLEEASIAAYYCGDRALGMQAAERIVANRDVQVHVREKAACNQTFYLDNLPVLQRGRFPIPDGLDEKYGMHYAGTNPTIVSAGDSDYEVHVRLVNYRQTNGRNYDAEGGVFRTRGAALRWSPEQGPAKPPEEVQAQMPPDWSETTINGLEDVRWVQHEGAVWFTATCCQVPGAGGWPRVVLGRMSSDLRSVERVLKLEYGKQGERDREKNWVPWSVQGELLLIYGYDPFVVVKVNTETGACTEVRRLAPQFCSSRWKGSTAPVPTGSGTYLMLVHETAYMPYGGHWEYSVYLHRFVEIGWGDEGPEIRRYSAPFTFERKKSSGACIEYAAGLVEAHGSRDWLITYGVEDREAAWAIVARATVDEMLGQHGQ